MSSSSSFSLMSSSLSSSTKKEKKQRRQLNAFETFFASCNVRFAMLVQFLIQQPSPGDDDKVHGVDTETLKRGIVQASHLCRLGQLQLDYDDDNWYLTLNDRNGQDKKEMDIVTISKVSDDDEDFGPTYFDKVMASETLPATGPLSIELIESSSSPGMTRAMIVNGNHALVDGRSLTHFVSTILKCSSTSSINILDNPTEHQISWDMIPDWKELVDKVKTKEWNESPPYLPTGTSTMLTIQELCNGNNRLDKNDEVISTSVTKHDDIRFETSAQTIEQIRKKLKVDGRGISITSFIVTLLMSSLANEYYLQRNKQKINLENGDKKDVDDNETDKNKNNNSNIIDDKSPSRDVSVSVLVDLRPALEEFQLEEIPQAIGTVTVSLPSDVFYGDTDDGTDTNVEEKKNVKKNNHQQRLLDNAVIVTSQLRERISRGEAIRCARALTHGEFDKASPSATIELSNLGLCDMTSSSLSGTTTMYTAQRFDEYDDVSCMTHTETNTGLMKWCIGVGVGDLDRTLIEKIFLNVINQMNEFAEIIIS